MSEQQKSLKQRVEDLEQLACSQAWIIQELQYDIRSIKQQMVYFAPAEADDTGVLHLGKPNPQRMFITPEESNGEPLVTGETRVLFPHDPD